MRVALLATATATAAVLVAGATPALAEDTVVLTVHHKARDGSPAAVFDIPQEDGAYRLETSASRTGVARLSSQVSVAWTFRSSAAETGLLPLSTIRFAPELDGATGRPGAVPVCLRDQHSETDRVAERLAVDVSFDEGRTWKAVQVTENSVVAIDYLPGNGTVSLRGKATDRHGNTVEQTIINAYQTGQGT